MSYYPDPHTRIQAILDSKASKKAKVNQISSIIYDYYCLGQKNTKQEIRDLLGVDDEIDRKIDMEMRADDR